MKLSDYLPLEYNEVRILVYKYNDEYFAISQNRVIKLEVPEETLGAEVVFAITRIVRNKEEEKNLLRLVREEAYKRRIGEINYMEDYGKWQ